MNTARSPLVITAILGAALALGAAAQQDSNAPVSPRALRPRVAGHGAEGPRLGVMVRTTPDGLQVTEVLDGTLASAVGVQPDDVLLRVDEQHVETVADVQLALSVRKPGDTVDVTVIRPGEGIVQLSGVLPEPTVQEPERPSREGPTPEGRPETSPDAPDDPRDRRPPATDGFRGGFLGVQLAQPDEGPAARDDQDGADDAPTAPESDAGSGARAAGGPGVEVVAVVPESAAWFAGLEPGDRLLSIDGAPIATSSDVVGAVSALAPGTVVELAWQRGGEQHSTRVRLGERLSSGIGQGLRMLPFDAPMPGLGAGADAGVPRLRIGQPGLWAPGMSHGFPFGDDDGMQDLHRQIQQFLQGFDLDANGAQRQSVRMEMRNGRGTLSVTRDGKTETWTLDDQGRWVPSDTTDAPAPDGGPTPRADDEDDGGA
jgi:membrane-associated protease RseP (regulator of RpoE activity)